MEGHTPVSDQEPRNAVVLDDLGSAPDGTGVADATDHCCDADVGEDDG